MATPPSANDQNAAVEIERLRAVFERAPVGLALVGLDGRWLQVNDRLCAITGYTREELLARRFQDITYPDDLASDLAFVERLLVGSIDHYTLEKRYIRKDGSLIWINLAGTLIRNSSGAPDYFIATIEDITERKRTEFALRESEERFRGIFEASPVAKVITLVADGRYLNVNAGFEQLFGWTRGELIGTPSTSTSIWLDPRERDVMIAELKVRGSIRNREMQVRTKERARCDTLVSVVPIVVDQQLCLLSTMIDITQRKQMEQAIEESRARLQLLSKYLLEAQEQERRLIARELHDEIGQSLTALKINLYMLQTTETSAANRAQESMALVDDLLERVRALSLDLRPGMLDDLGLAAALEWYVERLAQRTGIVATVKLDLDSAVPPTIATACYRIAQEALTNMVRHAEAHHVDVTVVQKDDMLFLAIQDDGTGFDVQAIHTQSTGPKSLGLLGMAERVGLMGGRLEVDSVVGQGTVVRAWFPLIAFSKKEVSSGGNSL